MIIYGPTDWGETAKPLAFWELEGEFRENNPDLYVSEQVPEDLAERFYQGTFNLDDIRFSRDEDEGAIREILSKNIELAFRRSGVKFPQRQRSCKRPHRLPCAQLCRFRQGCELPYGREPR